MSRWWPERALVRVGAAAGGRAAVGTAPAAARLEALVEGFERDLDARELPARSRLTVVLGGEAVRYRIVSGEAGAGAAERDATAVQAFAGDHHEDAARWRVRVHPARTDKPTLACATDAGLLDRLEAVARSRRLTLASLQPALMQAYNANRRQLPPAAWFAWLEGAWITLLLTTPDGPQYVRHAIDDRADLSRLAARASFTLGLDGDMPPLHIDCLPSHEADRVDEGEAVGLHAPVRSATASA